MRFVHQDNQVVKTGKVIEIGLTDIFGEPLDAGELASASLGIDLGDIEDVDVDGFVEKRQRTLTAVVVAGDDPRWPVNKVTDTGKDILGAAGIGKIFDEFVIDGQVRCQDKEVLDPFGLIQPGDEGPHQPGLTHAGCQGKADTGEVPFKVGEYGL